MNVECGMCDVTLMSQTDARQVSALESSQIDILRTALHSTYRSCHQIKGPYYGHIILLRRS